jgi:hypothetical protein
MPNKQLIKKMITLPLVGIWLCWLWHPATVTGQRTVDLPDPAICPSNIEVIIRPRRIILADSHETAEEKENAESDQSASAQENAPPDKTNSSAQQKSKTKPLKTFVPSEKVKADQAVDFPYDI